MGGTARDLPGRIATQLPSRSRIEAKPAEKKKRRDGNHGVLSGRPLVISLAPERQLVHFGKVEYQENQEYENCKYKNGCKSVSTHGDLGAQFLGD